MCGHQRHDEHASGFAGFASACSRMSRGTGLSRGRPSQHGAVADGRRSRSAARARTIIPPGRHCSTQAGGMSATPQVTWTRSYGALGRKPPDPSPAMTFGLNPADRRFLAAWAASSSSTSTVVTWSSPRRRASRPAVHPDPVPISRTVLPSSTSSNCRNPATMSGADMELVGTPWPSSATTSPSSRWMMMAVSAA